MSHSQSLNEVFGDNPGSELEPADKADVSSSFSADYSDPVRAAAEIEYGESRGGDVASSLKDYVSQFETLENLRRELDSRGHSNDNTPLENIYEGEELNCSARAAAQVAFSQLRGGEEGMLNLQYDILDILGLPVPGNIPVDNHVCYEAPDDIRPYDWGDQPENEEFPEQAIVGLRAANLLTRSDNPETREDLVSEVKALAPDGGSEFIDGFMRAYRMDSFVSRAMPGSVSKVYDDMASRIT